VVSPPARTWEVWQSVVEWRKEGLRGYSTLDAGPNPHMVCLHDDADELERRLRRHGLVEKVWRSELHPKGAHFVEQPSRPAACF
jgi:mevalonate pyrophosphate decarboxylase